MSFPSPWLLRKSTHKLPLTRLLSPSPSSSAEKKSGFLCAPQKQDGPSPSSLNKVCIVFLQDAKKLSTCIEIEKMGLSVSNDEGNEKGMSEKPSKLHQSDVMNAQCMINGSTLNIKCNARITRNVDDEFETKQKKDCAAECNEEIVCNSVFCHQSAKIGMDLDHVEAKGQKDGSVKEAEMVSNRVIFPHHNAKADDTLREGKLDQVESKEGQHSDIKDTEIESNHATSHHQDKTIDNPRDKNIDEIERSNGKTSNTIEDGEMVSKQEAQIINSICSYLSSNGWDSSTHMFLNEHTVMHLSDLIITKVIQRLSDLSLTLSFFQWAGAKIGYDTHSCHAYLLKLGEERHFDQMWELLDQMKINSCLITSETFRIFIKAYGKARQPGLAIDAFKRAVEYNPIIADIHIYGELLRTLFLSELIDDARLCYSQIVKDGLDLDAYALTSLIRGFLVSCDVADAKVCFDIILKEGLELDIFTHNALIEGFCKINALSNAMETFSTLQKSGLKPILSTFNILIEAFCKAGKLDDAIDIFSNMRTICLPNQYTFNIVLQGFLGGASVVKAMEFFTLMESEGWVDAKSFIYLSNGLRKAEQTQEMYAFLKTLFDKYGYTNQEICIAHLHNLCHLGSIGEAEEVFMNMATEIKNPNIPSYAMMISFYCRLERYDDAVSLLNQLRCRAGKPSSFCYTPLIGAMLKKKRLIDAMGYFKEMVELGIEVNGITCNLLLEELCEQGMAEDASMVCRTMLAYKLTIRSETLFLLMKCLYRQQKGEDASILFNDMSKRHCLPPSSGVLQALGVIEKMGLHAH